MLQVNRQQRVSNLRRKSVSAAAAAALELRNNSFMNYEHSQALGCVCYCGPRSHCPTIVNDNVSGDGFARCVCARLFAQRSSLCVRHVCITAACLRPEVTHWCPWDNTLWRRCSLIIPFKRTERNPSSHPLLLLLLLPSPPLPPPLCSTDAP